MKKLLLTTTLLLSVNLNALTYQEQLKALYGDSYTAPKTTQIEEKQHYLTYNLMPSLKLMNVDAPETKVNSNKWKYFTKEFGYSNEDMLKYGKEADEWSKKALELNPSTKFELTGDSDASGERDLVRSDVYALAGVEAGMLVPSRDALPEFWEANAEAKKNKLGLYRTLEGSRFMDDMVMYNKFGTKRANFFDRVQHTLWATPASVVVSTVVEIADWVLGIGGGSLGTKEEKTKMVNNWVGRDAQFELMIQEEENLRVETNMNHGNMDLMEIINPFWKKIIEIILFIILFTKVIKFIKRKREML